MGKYIFFGWIFGDIYRVFQKKLGFLLKGHSTLKIVKPWPQTLSLKTKTKGPWADTRILWATHPTPPITFKHEGGVPQQNPKSKTYSKWSPLLVCQEKKLRWTARGRTWRSPTCSVRASSILLVAPLSKSSIQGRLIQYRKDQIQVYHVDKNMVEQSSTVP